MFNCLIEEKKTGSKVNSRGVGSNFMSISGCPPSHDVKMSPQNQKLFPRDFNTFHANDEVRRKYF